ncbi:MAG TPA: molybdate ABC transporter substrate-binding protein [Chloroflexota bacterium]|nr:molybdate ABC transporter substrate-binding protein [Chloroflexota bacterium]
MTRHGLVSAALVLLAAALACSPPMGAGSPRGGPAAPSAAPVSGEVIVFAAASLTDAFKEIGAAFEAAYPGVRVTFNFGASSQLRTQLEQGAQADVFASADQIQMDRAKDAGLIAGPDRVFVRNRLVVIAPRSNPAGVYELKDLAKPGLRFVTAAPEVPIGVYTQSMLERLAQDPAYGPDFKEQVNANIVSREPNVRQVVAKVSLGEADAAVVYHSDVTPDVADKLVRIEIPDPFNMLATYPVAVVRNAPNPAGAEAFIAYVLGPQGQATLERWGFIAAGDLAEGPR